MASPIAIYSSARLARADWLRRQPEPARIEEAIRLDPLNAYAYTLRAETLEQNDQAARAEQAWRSAVDRNPHDAEARIRLALLTERRGAIDESEQHLLEAARKNHTWLPRWTLVNFYIRHQRPEDAGKWARLAFERASDDVTGLFAALDDSGIGIDDLLPENRRVLTAYLAYRTQRGPFDGLGQIGARLAALIPSRPAAWPGLDRRSGDECDARERAVLFRAVDKMLDSGEPAEAARLWNKFESAGALSGQRWSASTPVVNSRFEVAPFAGGLDWRPARINGIEIETAGELDIRLSGRQPQSLEAIGQRICLAKGHVYTLAVESRTADLDANNGLEWQIRDAAGTTVAALPVQPSEDWKRTTVGLGPAVSDRAMRLVLVCRRMRGAVRAEGEARFRLVTVEESR